MPQWGTQDYRSAVLDQLSQGSGGKSASADQDHAEHFENFSSGAPRRDVEAGVGEAFHPETLPSDQVEPEFRRAAEQMEPHQRAEVTHDLLAELAAHGLAPSWLQKLLGLHSTDPNQASAEDMAKLSEYSRQNHPEVFKKVVADKPFFVRLLSKPLVAAVVGIIAGKLLSRHYDQ